MWVKIGTTSHNYVSWCLFGARHAVPTGVKDGAEGGHLKGPTGELVKEPRIDSSALYGGRKAWLGSSLAI